MPALQLLLLGALELRCGTETLPKPPTQKSQALLAYLALHREMPQSRERLAGLFWADRPDRRARRSLTTSLWHIRRCLPDGDDLMGDASSVQLNPRMDLWVDVLAFESLVSRRDLASQESAIGLYRGDLMDGFYDDWVISERYRVQARYWEALANLMTGLEAHGDHRRALEVGLRLVREDPLREDACRLLMRCLCRLGQRNAALEHYRRCREIVRRDLNVELMAETQELHQAILDGRLEADPSVAASVPELAESEPAGARPPGKDPLDPLMRSPLVGRDREMALLAQCFEEAQHGRGGLVLLHGEAGVGKTRLVEEFADLLRWRGVRVLWGRCYEFERVLPYQPLSEALHAVISAMTPAELQSHAPWILLELSLLVPELTERLADWQDRDPPAEEEQQQNLLFRGVAGFLGKLLAEGPLVVILDDLHWATESTLQMIHFVVRNLADRDVLIVGTVRSESEWAESLLGAFQQQLGREGLVRSLDLAALTLEDVEAMVVEMSGGSEAVLPLARQLYAETEGNPFFLIEGVKALFESGLVSLRGGFWRGDFAAVAREALPLPQGVIEAVTRRVRRLDQDSRQALRVAAVLGSEFDADMLATTWSRGEDATLEALEVLLRRRLISEGSGLLGRDYAFRHHKIREIVYSDIHQRERHRLHARAGKAMESLHASRLTAVASELAFHFNQGRYAEENLMPRAVRYLLMAGDQARLAYAHHEAIDYYTQALALQKELGEHEQASRTLMRLGVVYHSKFEFAQAHQAFEDGFLLRQQAARQESSAHRPPAPHALRIRWRNPYCLDPPLVNDYVSAMVVDQLFRGLVSLTPELNLVPEVAERWEIHEGGRSYRFHLREDACWSDGRPVTAQDFEYSWKRALDPATHAPSSGLLTIRGGEAFHQGRLNDPDQVGVRALDDRTLAVELDKPVSHFLYQLADSSTFPVPPVAVKAHGATWLEPGKIISNGPFTLEEWKPGEYMRLLRNPRYSGRRGGNVDEVVLHFPEEPGAMLGMYEAGELDVLTLTDVAVHEGDRIRRAYAAEYVSAPWPFTVYLCLMAGQVPFHDVRLRQAFALATDRPSLANVAMRGMCAPGTGGYVPPGLPGHAPDIGLPYRPDQAQQLLAEVGHPAGSGLPRLQGLTVPPIDPLITEYLHRQWREALGIEVDWEVADWPAFLQRLRTEPPQMFVLASFANAPDPGDFLDTAQLLDLTGWASPDMEALVGQAGHVADQDARLDLLRQADQILMREASIIPLFYGRHHLLVKPWVSHLPLSALNRWFWQDTILEPH